MSSQDCQSICGRQSYIFPKSRVLCWTCLDFRPYIFLYCRLFDGMDVLKPSVGNLKLVLFGCPLDQSLLPRRRWSLQRHRRQENLRTVKRMDFTHQTCGWNMLIHVETMKTVRVCAEKWYYRKSWHFWGEHDETNLIGNWGWPIFRPNHVDWFSPTGWALACQGWVYKPHWL